MSLWGCCVHGVTGPMRCCDKAELVRELESTQGLDEASLRHLQLCEIRAMLRLPSDASHFMVLATIRSFYNGVAPEVPKRYQNYIQMRDQHGPIDVKG